MAEPEHLRQGLLYTLVGGAGTLVQYAVLVGAVSAHLLPAVPASVIGAIFGAIVNYMLNARFTFRTSDHRSAAPRFAVIALVGLASTWLVMKTCVLGLGMNYLLAQVLSTGVTLVVTYSLNALWTFRSPTDGA